MHNPETLETYAKIYEMPRKYWDEKRGKFFTLPPSDIELVAAEALRFLAKDIRGRGV